MASSTNEAAEPTDSNAGYLFKSNSNGGLAIQGNGHLNNCSWNWDYSDHAVCSFHIMEYPTVSVVWECQEDGDRKPSTADSFYFSTQNPHHH